MLCIAVLALMLFCNFHTGLVADDFSYLFSFGGKFYLYDPPFPTPDAERITSVGQIIWSMQCHRYCMNGRVLAHFLVQLFLLLPKWIFSVVNSAMFLLELIMLCKCAYVKKEERSAWLVPLLFVFSFASVWLFQLHFGQVNLWLDGAINYLWSSVIALLYILGYMNYVINGRISKSLVGNLAFVALGFAVGAYSENSAGAMLIFSFCMVAYKYLCERRVDKNMLAALATFAATVVGFIFLLSAPIELSGKMSDKPLLEQLVFGLNYLWVKSASLLPYLVLTLALFVLAAVCKADKNKLVISALLIICALASAFCLVFATYIALRSFYITLTLLIAANVILIPEFIKAKKSTAIICKVLTCVLAAALPYYIFIGFIGVRDVVRTYEITSSTEEYIISCAESGIEDVYIQVPDGLAETKYSALNGLVFLDADSTSFPNRYMAKYYGVKTVNLLS